MSLILWLSFLLLSPSSIRSFRRNNPRSSKSDAVVIDVVIFVPLQAILVLSLILKLPSVSPIHKLPSDLHPSNNRLFRNKDLSLQGISDTQISGQIEEAETLLEVVTSLLSLSNVEILANADFSIATLLESSRIKIQSSILDFGREFTQFVADRGRMTLIDIVINARPDPGSDGLVHADTHLTMAKCVPQNVFVGLSPIFGPCSSSVEISLSIFANIDHAVPLPYSPSPPVLQPSSITSLKAHSTILTSSTMVNVFNDIFATITNAPILGEVVAFPRCPMRITDYQMRYALN
ncbi:hypothetical protein BLNAU_18388 [Blattamonas nauphoetae]|uniref:Uncharacterized protein n=1 Tax=Blattamonas nauphoetae TaxID=2049346 RepID=A0ABQ9X4L3_9EUKA|nr:hypothetical protein BLNAU_18388 [Blattamonas nauphoetae]